jgi:hypothetical protein
MLRDDACQVGQKYSVEFTLGYSRGAFRIQSVPVLGQIIGHLPATTLWKGSPQRHSHAWCLLTQRL